MSQLTYPEVVAAGPPRCVTGLFLAASPGRLGHVLARLAHMVFRSW
jgi:hypothetical protein